MDTVLIIPARDEAETIGNVVRDVRTFFDGEIVVVDNDSRDATADIATDAGAMVVRESQAGYGAACMRGVAAAPTATAVFVFMDGDGSDHPADIPALLSAIRGGADLALAVRRGAGVERGAIAPAARFGNWLSGSLIGLLWGRRLHDLSPLKAIRAEALRRIDPRELTYGWTVEMLATAAALGMSIVEVEAGYSRRAGGSSKVSGQLGPSLRAGTRILGTLARVWLRHPDPVRSGACAGLLAALAVVGSFTVWLNTSAPSSFGVNAAAVIIAWPLLLLGVAAGALGGALIGRARKGILGRPPSRPAAMWPEIRTLVEATRILVVDDEPMVVEVIERYLRREGFAVTTAPDGRAALEAWEASRPHLLVLDLMLPQMDGFEVCRRVRSTSKAPIIMLTARGDEMDRIAGFELGADDYLAKPFSPRELVVRVKAILRRCYDTSGSSPPGIPLRCGDLVVDRRARTVELAGERVELSPLEFDLLCFFMERPGEVFTRDQLMLRVWSYEWYGDSSTVTVHVRRLRTKVERDPSSPVHLKTAWGMGYKWEP